MTTIKRKSKADDGVAIRRKLHDVKLRGTQSRIAVLQCLQVAKGPMSHAEIAEQLAGRGLDKASIYRNLNELSEAGLLARIDLGDHAWRFEMAEDGGHLHFYCNSCGAISCLAGMPAHKALTPAVSTSLPGTLTDVLFKGVCRSCERR